MGLSMRCQRLLIRLLTVHPLVWGFFTGVAVYLTVKAIGSAALSDGSCVFCWSSSPDTPGTVLPALGVAGGAVGSKMVKDAIEKKVGGPIFAFKDMYDIASQDTPEGQAKAAGDVYKSLLMIGDSPPGSVGGDLADLVDSFFGSQFGIDDIGPDDDDD